MLRVTESKNAEAAKQYFGKSMVRSDYYSEGQEIAGLWGGRACLLYTSPSPRDS